MQSPIIASISEIDNLLSRGYITVRTRPNNDPLRYAICPVIEDPTDGGIARDQFLAITLKPDGRPVEPSFFENFESLRTNGRLGRLRDGKSGNILTKQSQSRFGALRSELSCSCRGWCSGDLALA